MDQNNDLTLMFENGLNRCKSRKSLLFYDQKSENTPDKLVNDKYNSKDVLLNISKQLNAIRAADNLRRDLRTTNQLKRYKESKLVPLNIVSLDTHKSHIEHNTNNFETQCISDSQLINIVEDAEKLVPVEGATQEFQRSFHESNAVKSEECNNNRNFVEGIMSNVQKSPVMHTNLNQYKDTLYGSNKHDNNFFDTYKLEEDVSPVIDYIEPLSITKNECPLLCTLEVFENFEKLAFPIVENNIELEAVKQIINSQIFNNELCLVGDKVSALCQYNRSPSPVLSIKNTQKTLKKPNDTQIKSALFKESYKELVDKATDQNYVENSNDFVDEILFSSDEVDNKSVNCQDLPLTCALETSFYNQHKILDKTMYVGFQTASNKSIIINTESFAKAQSVLEDLNCLEPTLTELVAICDNKQNISQRTYVNTNNHIEDNKTHQNGCVKSETVICELELNEQLTHFNEDENKREQKNSNSKKYEIINSNEDVGIISKDIKVKENQMLNRSCTLFHTASHKRITISEKALARCEEVFKDINLDDNYEETKPLNASSPIKKGSQKELSQNIQLDDQNIIREFENDLIDFNVKVCKRKFLANVNPISNKNKILKQTSIGFETVSNKEIKIQKNALLKTKSLHDDFDLSNNMNSNSHEIMTQSKCHKIRSTNFTDNSQIYHKLEKKSDLANLGFKTASNKSITVSSEALVKNKKLFEELEMNYVREAITDNEQNNKLGQGFDSTNCNKIDNKMCKSNKNLPLFKNFHTANIKQLNTFNVAVLGGKRLIENSKQNHMETADMFKGFQTASNRQIKISNQALAKSKLLFDDLNLNGDNVDEAFKNKTDEEFEEFQTASKKPDKILEQTLAKNKKILQDLEDHECDKQHFTEKTNNKEFRGFQTASNKEVKISEQALAKSKKILQDLEVHKYDKQHFAENTNKKEFRGFQTASNKQVKISEQALAKSRKILQDLEVHEYDEQHFAEKSNNKDFRGFQTASNKQVKISEQALAKSRKILQDLDVHEYDEQHFAKKSNNKDFRGFQTASNKQVKISEQAMSKSRALFEDLDLNINDKQNKNQGVTLQEYNVFQTNSNEQVNVSSKTLVKSKCALLGLDCENKPQTLFKKRKTNSVTSIEDTKNKEKYVIPLDNKIQKDMREEKKDDNQVFSGFKTASNKRVKVSNDALALSKKLMQDLDVDDEVKRMDIDTTEKEIMKMSSHEGRQLNLNTASSKKVNINKEALLDSKKILDMSQKEIFVKPNTVSQHMKIKNEDINSIDSLLDSQVLNNFEVTMYTEDFCKDVKRSKSKRSGSPILLCRRDKKRKKFEAPSKNSSVLKDNVIVTNKTENNATRSFIFDENYKKRKTLTLQNLQDMERMDGSRIIIDQKLNLFNYGNVLEFIFTKERNELSKASFKVADIKEYFLTLVNLKLVPDGWLDNHLKLIILKLITYERKYTRTLQGVCSVRNVLEQLKYRYNRELFNVERPVLRKLLEKDDIPTKTIILLVIDIYMDDAEINSVTGINVELLLTDGWYCIKACLDQMLIKLVREQKIRVGTKLAIHGAELLNCDQGMAPWEDTSRVRLKIFGNSTRRARWDARLGHIGAGAILTRLSRVQLDGGKVSKLRVLVTRVYPTIYVEKFEDGSTVTRSERLEHLYQMKYDSERQSLLEKINEEVEKEMACQESQDSECDTDVRRSLDSGSQLHKLLKQSKDPSEILAHLSNSQCVLLQDYSIRRREKLLETVQGRIEERLKANGLNLGRNVVPVTKIRLADIDSNGEVSKALMSVWRPNEAMLDIIKEGSWIDVFNVIPTALRFSEIQLSAGRQTIFRKSNYKCSDESKKIASQLKRTCSTIKELAQNPILSTQCYEVDTAGLVFLIEPSMAQFDSIEGQLFQNVYLTDAEKNIVCINFWGGLKKFGYENVLDTGQVVACINLQKRAGNTRKSIQQFRATEFSHFTKTSRIESLRRIVDGLNRTLSLVNLKKFCEQCVTKRNNHSMLKSNNAENVSPYRMNYSDFNSSKYKAFIYSPLARKHNNLEDALNLSGLDFESTFKQTDTQDMSPCRAQRKKKVSEKIAKLKMYGEPPPITPIHIINKCKNATSAFKSPLTSKNEADNTSKEKITTNRCSDTPKSGPIIGNIKNFKNRNCGDPVKLNFAHDYSNDCNNESKHDPFAEEFEVSPPLSLD